MRSESPQNQAPSGRMDLFAGLEVRACWEGCTWW